MSWTDTFTYADGPLGAPWTITTGTPTISSGEVTGEGYTALIGESADPSEAHIHVTNIGIYGGGVGPIVKANAACTQAYAATFIGDYSQYYVRILKLSLGSWNIIHTDIVTGDPTSVTSVGVQYSGGTLTSYINGVSVGTHDDSDYSANTYIGIYGGSTVAHIDQFDTSTYSPPPERSMVVTPHAVWVVDLFTGMLATLDGDTWSDTYPYDTTFSVDHGIVLTYAVMTPTTASFTYYSGGYVGTVTVTESKWGLTDTFEVTASEPPDYIPNLGLDDKGSAIVNRTGAYCESGRILTTCEEVDGVEGVSILEVLASLAYALGGVAGQPEPTHPIDGILAEAYQAINASTDVGAGPFGPAYDEPLSTTLRTLHTIWTDRPATGFYTVVTLLDEVLDALSPTHTQTLDDLASDLGVHGQVLYASILEAIRSTRGDDVTSLLGILTELGIIRSAHSYTLESIMDAIAAIPATDLAAVLHKLDHIQPSEAVDLSTLNSAIVVVDSVADGVAASLTAMRTPDAHTLQDILDAIAAIPPPTPANTYRGAPVWPGLAGATVGASAPLSNGMTVAGPLHGLLFTITTQPAGAGKYGFGPYNSWSKVGACIFTSDRGDHERAQSFNLDAQVICPKDMAVAASATIRLNSGWGGTVRPFTIT